MNLSIMWHQIIPLLISLSVFFSCEEAPVEEVLIEDQPECKPLIVSDSVFNGYYLLDTSTACPIQIYNVIPEYQERPPALFIGMNNGCFQVPTKIITCSGSSIRLVWDGQLQGDTATCLFLMYGNQIPTEGTAVLKIALNAHRIDTIGKLVGKSKFTIRLLYNKSGGIWQEKFVDLELD